MNPLTIPTAVLASTVLLAAQQAAPPRDAAPIQSALASVDEDVRRFDQHVTTLANPFFEGRVPGSDGMDIARDYFEWYLRRAGTEPAFGEEGGRSYRQPFTLRGGNRRITEQHLAVDGEPLSPDTEFTILGLSATGEATGEAVFVGYAIDDGLRDYTSYPDDADLEGKIAFAFRFEPMDEQGRSQWARRGPWTRDASLRRKAQSVQGRGARALVLLNPPGADDPRADELPKRGSGGRSRGIEIPVAVLGNAAARRLFAQMLPGHDLASLRRHCDGGAVVEAMKGEVTLRAGAKDEELVAENVGGVIPGRGDLADRWIVIGGHLDHLGIGRYGARDQTRVGRIHPGADDNATGSAAVLMLARSLAEAYEALPPDRPVRSILLVGFDAEEAGLHGSRHYVREPIAPLDRHALMINFDMIGRITDRRLSVSGAASAEGLEEWLAPIVGSSPLDVELTGGPGFGGSDHLPFAMKGVPFLFAILAELHADYHTPDDVSWKINRVDAVHTIHLFHEIALAAATRVERFVPVQR